MTNKNINDMSKDELLDQTAILGIEADYTMSIKKLKVLLKNNVPTKEVIKSKIEVLQSEIDELPSGYERDDKIDELISTPGVIDSLQTIKPVVLSKKVTDKLTERQKQELIRTKY